MLKNHQSFRNPIRYEFGKYQILNFLSFEDPNIKNTSAQPITHNRGRRLNKRHESAFSYLVIRPPTIALPDEIMSDFNIFELLRILHEKSQNTDGKIQSI